MTVQDNLANLIEAGLTFSDCTAAFAARRSRKELAYVAAAREIHFSEDGPEVDESAQVSLNDDDPESGAYVQAWVWVSVDDLEDV